MATAQAGRKRNLLPAITMVLVIAALFVVSYVLVFMNPNLIDLQNQPRTGLTGHSFLNPVEGPVTRNGGGWDITVNTVTGPDVPLEELVIAVKAPADGASVAQVWKLLVKGPGANASALSANGWSLRAGGRTNASFRYANGSVPVLLNTTTAASLREDQFHTVEGAVLIFYDPDFDGKLSNGDRILAYKDVNGDGAVELRKGTQLQVQTTGGKLVAAAQLE